MSVLQVNNITDTGGSTLLGRKNAIINGNFDVWQRGSGAFVSSGYTSDRWYILRGGSTTLSTTRQTFALGQTDVPYNPKYYLEASPTTGGLASSFLYISQAIEGVSSFAGETVTLSFYAKADASKNIAVEFVQSFGSGGSPSTVVTGISVTTVALTAAWVKQTVTVTIPSITGTTLGTDGNDHLSVIIWLDAGSDYNARTNSLGNQSGTFEFAQVQLEAGSVATPFERRSYGEELALCQRYFYRLTSSTSFDLGICYIRTASAYTHMSFPVSMRGLPSFSSTNGTNDITQFYGSASALISSSTTSASTFSKERCRLGVTQSAAASGDSAMLQCNSGLVFDFDAEL